MNSTQTVLKLAQIKLDSLSQTSTDVGRERALAAVGGLQILLDIGWVPDWNQAADTAVQRDLAVRARRIFPDAEAARQADVNDSLSTDRWRPRVWSRQALASTLRLGYRRPFWAGAEGWYAYMLMSNTRLGAVLRIHVLYGRHWWSQPLDRALKRYCNRRKPNRWMAN